MAVARQDKIAESPSAATAAKSRTTMFGLLPVPPYSRHSPCQAALSTAATVIYYARIARPPAVNPADIEGFSHIPVRGQDLSLSDVVNSGHPRGRVETRSCL